MSWKLPLKREFGWNMKALESAKTDFVIDHHNVFTLTIEHDIIKGVTPVMLNWWFRNIGGNVTYRGKTMAKYLLWHPVDHIHRALANPSPGGGASAGATFHIVEAFGGNMNYLIDSKEVVQKLNETGIRLVRKLAGTEVFSLQHDFFPVNGGTRYVSKMIVGTSKFPMKHLFNFCIRSFVFTKAMGFAWLKHNVEEVGNFEYFLPEIYNLKLNT